MYIEITTLNQKLVTKKNRKARRVQELYPEVSVKVFYQRDYLHLLVKYGLGAAVATGGHRARRPKQPRPLDFGRGRIAASARVTSRSQRRVGLT